MNNIIYIIFFSVFLAGLLQTYILLCLFFVSYINNLSNQIIYTVKQLAVENKLFFIPHNVKTAADELNSDLKANLN